MIFTHVWIARRRLPQRHGQVLRILVACRGKFLVEFSDGHKAITVRGTFKRHAPCSTLPAPS